MKNNILIIAGEPSGEIRGSELIRELKKLLPEASFWGIGGDNMEKLGVELIGHIRDFSIVGIWGVIKNLGKIRKQFRAVTSEAEKRGPSLAILIDYPGFNLRLAEILTNKGIPVVYYVIPQVWAWGAHRVKTLKKYVAKAIVLFGFEKPFLEGKGVNSVFVGHPLLDACPILKTDARTGMTIALLPGSRKNEIKSLFPPILEAARVISRKLKNVSFVLAKSSNIPEVMYEKELSKYRDLAVSCFKDSTFDALNNSDFAIVASGTATLETAIMEKPMVIIYKSTIITYLLARRIMRIRFLGLANLIAGREIVPECLQNDATGEKIAGKLLEIIEDPSLAAKTRQELRKVKAALGEKGAARRAAEEVVKTLQQT